MEVCYNAEKWVEKCVWLMNKKLLRIIFKKIQKPQSCLKTMSNVIYKNINYERLN